jgi:hypothetical protein
LWRLESQKPYIRTREIAKSETPKRGKSSDRSQPFAERFRFRHFGSCEDKRSGFLVLELPKSRNVIQLCRRTRPSISGISTFRVSEGGKVKNLDNRIRKSRSLKPRKGEKPDTGVEHGQRFRRIGISGFDKWKSRGARH